MFRRRFRNQAAMACRSAVKAPKRLTRGGKTMGTLGTASNGDATVLGGTQTHNSVWFARFQRKSIVVSRSLEMVELTMALFAKFHVNGNDAALLVSLHL
jgi:IS1 family transposase